MTHRDGFPRLSARSAWRGDAGHRKPRAPSESYGPSESLGKPPFRSDRRTGSGRIGGSAGKPGRCPAGPAASLLPARWPDASPARSLWVIISETWYKEIEVGGARLGVTRPTQHCAATTVDPETAARDMIIPQALKRGFGHVDTGVYAEVVSGGEVATGDRIAAPERGV